MSNATIDVLIWVFVYGGLLGVSAGVFVRRSATLLGSGFIAAGVFVALCGVGLWLWRARRTTDDS